MGTAMNDPLRAFGVIILTIIIGAVVWIAFDTFISKLDSDLGTHTTEATKPIKEAPSTTGLEVLIVVLSIGIPTLTGIGLYYYFKRNDL